MKMLVTTEPHKTIRHPDFGQRMVQNGMLFFMDGAPMGLPENHRAEKPAPVATPAGKPAAASKTAAATTAAPAAETPPAEQKVAEAESPGADLDAALAGKFFTLKAFMRKTYSVDPKNKDEAMAWLRENGKVAA